MRAGAGICLLSTALLASSARAQILEPNGISVPVTNPTEINLQTYFDSQAEAINAVANAAVDPGIFLPLCDFQATLVLSQSQALAGIAWYNVPASPTAAPTDIYLIVPPGTPVGQTITSADVRSNPNYAQGLIGFVLMKGTSRVYYSEVQRNVYCSGCQTPGYWKMALVYQSTRMPNSYYLAFEDWEGANQTTWFGNDGDFNDKVFRISGVTCQGGGSPCDTGKPGVCSSGVTQCQPDGQLACKQQIAQGPETCDNLDNDCNGQIDDGPDLCPSGFTCIQGTCIHACGVSEFDCVDRGFQCVGGMCIDPACVGKSCDPGLVCRRGACVGGCGGVKCPLDQECRLGACVDPCAGVACPGAVCERGACVTQCRCRACASGQTCAGDGHCVDDGCQSMTCPSGQVCRQGACVDACRDAVCPGGAACHTGLCDAPPTDPGTGAGGAPPTDGGGGGGGGGMAGAGGSGGAGPSDAGADAAADGPRGKIKPACGCGSAPGMPGGAAGLLLLAGLLARRRRP